MSTEMIIDTEYNGYVFVGWAVGRFQTDPGEMMPYAQPVAVIYDALWPVARGAGRADLE